MKFNLVITHPMLTRQNKNKARQVTDSIDLGMQQATHIWYPKPFTLKIHAFCGPFLSIN
jgi:hypothetical protein